MFISDIPTVPLSELQSADIVFLLDGSDDMLPSEKQIWDFFMEFLKQLEIGPNRIQVALIEYSRQPTVHFLLNRYTSKDDMLSYLRYTELTGGPIVNIGASLDYVMNNVFTPASGSRAVQGVPQILIVLNARKSEDDILGSLEMLRNAGIAIYSVGINNADRLEIDQLAHSPETSFFITEMSDFMLVRQQIISGLATHRDTLSPRVGE